jgi:multiple sugar transport system permease protein/putative aldouronate transport system permease protein
MYLASIAGVDQELYEAARVDGAGRFTLMRHITLPALLPTFFVLLMLSIANFLNNGLDQFYVFQNSFNKEHIQVLDLYVYNVGMTARSPSLATAIGMLKSIVSVTLLFIVNNISKKLRGESII